MQTDVNEMVNEALEFNKVQILQFWQFVEAQGLVLNNDADVQRALFVFLVGDEWLI